MQVRKFEAKTMKEALALVKLNMGPDAIILSVKDHSQRFGLKGEKSVEITAAASEKNLRLKEIAEKKLTEAAKRKYQAAPAAIQKKFISESAHRPINHVVSLSTKTPYIEIVDDELIQTGDPAESRVKGATQRAFETLQALEPPEVKQLVTPVKRLKKVSSEEDSELRALRKEIAHLKTVLAQMNQTPKEFVSRHPGAEFDLPFELSGSFEILNKAGLELNYVVTLLREAKKTLSFEQLRKPALIKAWLAKKILDQLLIVEERFNHCFQIFVGPSGQGKTSTLVKIASELVIIKKKKICILTTDSTRLGASEQLKIYAKILNVPFAVVRSPQDFKQLEPALRGLDHVLLDFPGLDLKSSTDARWVKEMIPDLQLSKSVHYVQSLLVGEREAIEIAERYGKELIDDVIFTGLDLAARHGLVLNFQNRFHWPLHSFGIGPSIPEDIEVATKERVIDLIFKISGKFDQN